MSEWMSGGEDILRPCYRTVRTCTVALVGAAPAIIIATCPFVVSATTATTSLVLVGVAIDDEPVLSARRFVMPRSRTEYARYSWIWATARPMCYRQWTLNVYSG